MIHLRKEHPLKAQLLELQNLLHIHQNKECLLNLLHQDLQFHNFFLNFYIDTWSKALVDHYCSLHILLLLLVVAKHHIDNLHKLGYIFQRRYLQAYCDQLMTTSKYQEQGCLTRHFQEAHSHSLQSPPPFFASPDILPSNHGLHEVQSRPNSSYNYQPSHNLQ